MAGIIFDSEFELSGPTLQCNEPRQKEGQSNVIGDVSKSGIVSNVTHDPETNTFDWHDVTHKVGRNVRASDIDDHDNEQIRLNGLDATRYAKFKLVWADGIGAEKAENDSRLGGMKGVSRAYRKLYWKAMNAAESSRKRGGRVGGNPSPTHVFEWEG